MRCSGCPESPACCADRGCVPVQYGYPAYIPGLSWGSGSYAPAHSRPIPWLFLPCGTGRSRGLRQKTLCAPYRKHPFCLLHGGHFREQGARLRPPAGVLPVPDGYPAGAGERCHREKPSYAALQEAHGCPRAEPRVPLRVQVPPSPPHLQVPVSLPLPVLREKRFRNLPGSPGSGGAAAAVR